MTIPEQMTAMYKTQPWQHPMEPDDVITKYFESIINSGKCITISFGDKLLGYIEFDVVGKVCLIRNIFILPEYRNGRVIRMIRNRLFDFTKCRVYTGFRQKLKKIEVQLRSKH